MSDEQTQNTQDSTDSTPAVNDDNSTQNQGTSAGDDSSSSSSNQSASDTPASPSGTDNSSSTSNDTTSSNTGSGDSEQTPASPSGADNSSSTSNDTTSSNTGSGDSDQTPAAKLTLDTIQPQSTSADSSMSSDGSTATYSPAATTTNAQAMDDGGGGKGGVSVSDIIAIGTTVAKIMAASSPDYTMKSNPVAVLPKDVDPVSLTGVVVDPRELKVTLNFRNKLSMLICNLPIVVQWRYGGSNNGVGRYINNACIFLDSGTDVGVFYKVDIDAAFTGPWNAGAAGKPQIAAIDLKVEVKVTDKISPEGFNIVLTGTIRGDGGGNIQQRP